ncbi:hypothetical protein, partial [Streptomyces sp. NPDC006996]|uniref:hypothetical protein n=1 Tax=Streptomyces sp. NPDC006996 TaxID=3156908 RepID=UPI0033CF1A2B
MLEAAARMQETLRSPVVEAAMRAQKEFSSPMLEAAARMQEKLRSPVVEAAMRAQKEFSSP